MSNELQLLEFDYQGTKLSCPLQEGMRMIPVRPVCKLLGIDFSNQNKWLKSHPLYSEVYIRVDNLRSDGTEYPEMRCLSVFDMFGWLNHLSIKNKDEQTKKKLYAFLKWLRELNFKRYTENQVVSQRDQEELAIREKLEQLDEKDAELTAAKLEVKKERVKYKQRLEQIIVDKRNGQISMKLE